MREIEQNYVADSESEDSVRSEEILESYYPVKPRRTQKLVQKHSKHSTTVDFDSYQENETDQSNNMDFIRVVESCRRDVYEAEKSREKLEIRYQVNILETRTVTIILLA